MGDDPDPIAEKLKKGVGEITDENAAASGRQMLEADFRRAAKQRAAAEFEALTALLRERGAVIDAQRPPQTPSFKFVEVNHRLEAGKFAVQLVPLPGFDTFRVRVLVGLHPNAHVFMLEVPNIPTDTEEYQPSMDEHGFSWVHVETGEKATAAEIINDALEALAELLEADLRLGAQRWIL